MSNDSEFHLLPGGWHGHEASTLRDCYARAFANARELFIVSAFLTEWPSSAKLNRECETFLLVVGADFGTTRRAALEAALAWLPKRFRGNLLAFNQKGVNFHPKAVLWREGDNSCHFLVGSSNLTKAAFESNVEANVTLQLSEEDYGRALEWLAEIEGRSVEVNDRWLARYKEAPVRGGGSRGHGKVPASNSDDTGEVPVFDLALEISGAADRRQFESYLSTRREQRINFDAKAKRPLLKLLRASAVKASWTEHDNRHFYDELRRLLGADQETRMGGLQWVIRGKHADHQELAKSLVAVIDARPWERDAVVCGEKDRLHEAGVTTRSALLTELLCHFFPRRYPILDEPVRAWRSRVGFDSRVGGTEGERYVRLARAMRAALQDAGTRRLGIADLAELDTLIWFLDKKRTKRRVPA